MAIELSSNWNISSTLCCNKLASLYAHIDVNKIIKSIVENDVGFGFDHQNNALKLPMCKWLLEMKSLKLSMIKRIHSLLVTILHTFQKGY